MNNKSNVLLQAEVLIKPLALQHVPQESAVEAVIDQWLHAIATDSQFYCNPEISKPEALKVEVVNLLQKNGLHTTRSAFFSDVFDSLKLKPDFDSKFRFIDLFAGIGGVRLGFQQSGGVCVFSSEFDKHAQQTYKNNHGEVPFGDITKIPGNEIPEHDVLLAGFPCQPFSHAGLKLGIEDTRGTLFHDIANILETKKPKFALLENVKGLISHDKGYTLKVILKTLTKIGYSCNIPKSVIEHGSTKEIQTLAKEMVLKSVDFGIPQNRQRIYIVLWRDGVIDKFEYPKPLAHEVKVGDKLEKNPDPKLTISDRLWEGHQRRKIQNKLNGKGFGYGLVTEESPYTNTISARYYKDGSEVLIFQDGKNPRKISPREAARLQGFPDEFEPSASKVQAYKQFGNSVTVNVVMALAKRIVSYME
ncbi:DNA (cytosine-5-)-methyltransferase [Pseudoalteromonas sp. S201]|jgi:DNA (cytosine-5)-methyltransferase 1|uniref:DNA cytosine methyltransferase n=1 Tax=unclassified Pseudoalteromonas TaxID=194690 RepID=UPI0003F79E6C|nr:MULTISPECIES: DNA cytosine methyltransferase [unclassified Pseudoalteromonas]TMS93967.1 DNA (cytosine-5-)-methyltransferase [Pseudoalteromonas sp. S201]